jgi:hypothetical protein
MLVACQADGSSGPDPIAERPQAAGKEKQHRNRGGTFDETGVIYRLIKMTGHTDPGQHLEFGGNDIFGQQVG